MLLLKYAHLNTDNEQGYYKNLLSDNNLITQDFQVQHTLLEDYFCHPLRVLLLTDLDTLIPNYIHVHYLVNCVWGLGDKTTLTVEFFRQPNYFLTRIWCGLSHWGWHIRSTWTAWSCCSSARWLALLPSASLTSDAIQRYQLARKWTCTKSDVTLCISLTAQLALLQEERCFWKAIRYSIYPYPVPWDPSTMANFVACHSS